MYVFVVSIYRYTYIYVYIDGCYIGNVEPRIESIERGYMATNTLRRGSARIGVRARAPVTPDPPLRFLRTEYNDWTWIDRWENVQMLF